MVCKGKGQKHRQQAGSHRGVWGVRGFIAGEKKGLAKQDLS